MGARGLRSAWIGGALGVLVLAALALVYGRHASALRGADATAPVAAPAHQALAVAQGAAARGVDGADSPREPKAKPERAAALRAAPPAIPGLAVERFAGAPRAGTPAAARVEARSARARTLNTRLDRRIRELEARLELAPPAERAELERTLTILERTRDYRARLVGPRREPARPSAEPLPNGDGAQRGQLRKAL
jgi:hypothetical protein